jgi:hypothetical protein
VLWWWCFWVILTVYAMIIGGYAMNYRIWRILALYRELNNWRFFGHFDEKVLFLDSQ